MASEKRKATITDRPSKRSKSETKDARTDDQKVNKNNGAPSKSPAKAERDGEEGRRPVRSSILQSEEKAFPRGGASVLTPLEQKQIKLDAERDVLFEQAGGRKPVSDEYGEEEDAGGDRSQLASSKKRRKDSRRKPDTTITEKEGTQIRVQGLSYKNLVAGSLVLGQIASITSKDLVVALPNNLTGFVPLTSISERLNKRIEALLDEDEKDDGAADEDDDDIDLKALFNVGQYLRVCVTSTSDESTVNGTKKSKRHIELAINPSQVNAGLIVTDLKQNMMVQASVRSVEDHGLVMDLGFEGDDTRGFISKKELGKSWEITKVQEGQVLLCCVTGNASSGQVVKLCPDASRIGDAAKYQLSDAPTIDAFLPGTAVELLVTDAGRGGVVGKIMGLLDATADIVHSGSGGRSVDITKDIKAGQKLLARIVSTFPTSDEKKVGVSLLDHVKGLREQSVSGKKKPRVLQPSEIVEEAKVIQVEPSMGLFLDLGVGGQPGFAHISRLSDTKIETLFETSGPLKIDSIHRARILSYNPVDGLYNVSLEKKVLDQPFLRIEDVRVGQVVKGTVDRLILGAKGITGVLVSLADGISGLIPEMHLADVHLQHPEKKFREGFPLKARVLSVDLDKRQIRLTMKKTLLNSDAQVWHDYHAIKAGDQSPGTIINLKSNGAVVQFYGNVRAWLPVAEMSEAYIADPSQHFRNGQTVTVRVLSVNPEEKEMKVSCKDPVVLSEEQEGPWETLKAGQIVGAIVSEITGDAINLTIEETILKAVLRVSHLTDGSDSKNQSALKQIRVGQKLTKLVLLDKLDRSRLVVLSNKPSLVKAASADSLISSFQGAEEGREVSGFVRNITPDGIFVEFAMGTVGYLPKSQITNDKLALPAFGHRKDQSITSRILATDPGQKRFLLTLKSEKKDDSRGNPEPNVTDQALVNPVDGVSKSLSDYSLGKSTKARIISVKDTQLNVQLADKIQGRVDVSEIFDAWDDIKDRKHPLRQFKVKQVIDVTVLGIHDARNHRFLPVTHRQSRIPVYELTAKTKETPKTEDDLLTLDKVEAGSSWISYVNNVTDSCLWVNLSPNVRGRVDLMDMSDDVSKLQDVSESFPIGSAIKVRVKNIDASSNRLDLTAASGSSKSIDSLDDLSTGMTLPGKVFRVTERSLVVALSDNVNGAVPLTELADNYEEANPSSHAKGEVIRVSVVEIDLPNKRLFLSVRPSKILSSSLAVEDPSIISLSQLKVNDVVRGFVKLVRDNGIIIALGPRVEAFVRVADLSDSYIKDWKSAYEIDQLVKGKILSVDPALNHVQLSLKGSHVDKDYVPPVSWSGLEEGQTVTGKVRKVEEFGVFIDVDNTQPRVSGLCHRSQIADGRNFVDVRKLYEEGDVVKAKILSIDVEKRRISFGLKASYFADGEQASDLEMSDRDAEEGVQLDDESDDDGGIDLDLTNVADAVSEEGQGSDEMSVDEEVAPVPRGGLKTNGFDWTGAAGNTSSTANASDSEAEGTATLKKRKRKAQTFTDRTGDLDANGPQSTADYERILLTSPHNATLWIEYMAFQLRLGEIQLARDIGARALRTIHMRESDEKLAVWIALLNLEVSYGSDESLESLFADAVQVQDPFTVYSRMAEIWTAAARTKKADETYDAMVSKKEFRARPELWIAYATFLFQTANEPGRARALLSKALLSVHEREKRALTAKFAALEFKVLNGDAERGRTIFENLVTEWPRWSQGWDMWVDLERGLLKGDDKEEGLKRVRGLFERMAKGRMKKRRARFVFKRWLEFEEKEGDAKDVERVKAIAKEYVENMKGGQEDEGDE